MDVCPKDHGVFLDAGELASIEEKSLRYQWDRVKDGFRRLILRQKDSD